MKGKNLFILFLIGVFLLGFSSCAFAMGRMPAHMGGEKLVERMGKHLELTDAQKDKLLTIVKETEEEIEKIRLKNKELLEKLNGEMQKDHPDKASINRYVEEVGQNMTQAQIKRMNVILEFRKELTPEQLEKFKELHKKRKENFDKKRKRRYPFLMNRWNPMR